MRQQNGDKSATESAQNRTESMPCAESAQSGPDNTATLPEHTNNAHTQQKCAVLLPEPDAVPADLAAVVNAWPTLPEPIKAGVLAMVKAASDSVPEHR
jgi:hypothetical protein